VPVDERVRCDQVDRRQHVHGRAGLPRHEQVEHGEIERLVERLREPVLRPEPVALHHHVDELKRVRVHHRDTLRDAGAAGCEQQIGDLGPEHRRQRVQRRRGSDLLAPEGARAETVDRASLVRHEHDRIGLPRRHHTAQVVHVALLDDHRVELGTVQHRSCAGRRKARVERHERATGEQGGEHARVRGLTAVRQHPDPRRGAAERRDERRRPRSRLRLELAVAPGSGADAERGGIGCRGRAREEARPQRAPVALVNRERRGLQAQLFSAPDSAPAPPADCAAT
jgi:hypothetical protein